MATLKLTEKTLAAIPLPPTGIAQTYHWDPTLHGFGVVIGRTGRRTFVVRRRVAGKLRKVTIGVAGQPRDSDGARWTVQLAKLDALKRLGQMADGKVPVTSGTRGTGPTLSRGIELHTANMVKKQRSKWSIDTLQRETERHLEGWLDRPMVEMTGADLVKIHERLTADAGPHLANRIVAHVSAIWNALDKVHELPGRNPARAVTRNSYEPSRKRVEKSGLPAWYAKVQAIQNHVRRDLQMFCLFTGMRRDAACRTRWEHVDEDRGALNVPNPKGGAKRAFTLPLPSSVLDMLKERQRENKDIFGPYKGGDGGWIFPSLSRSAPFVVQPVAEPKEYRVDKKTKKKVAILPGLHVLRRTYLSVAQEAGVSELDRHVLANHAYGRQNVNATYIAQAFDHLAGEQAKIEAKLWACIKGAGEDGKAKLRVA